jgi:hypothetical protein
MMRARVCLRADVFYRSAWGVIQSDGCLQLEAMPNKPKHSNPNPLVCSPRWSYTIAHVFPPLPRRRLSPSHRYHQVCHRQGHQHNLWSNYQVALRWQLQKGVMINPRTRNPAHQTDDLATAKAGYGGVLTAEQVAAIDVRGLWLGWSGLCGCFLLMKKRGGGGVCVTVRCSEPNVVPFIDR